MAGLCKNLANELGSSYASQAWVTAYVAAHSSSSGGGGGIGDNIPVFAPTTDVTIGNGKAYFRAATDFTLGSLGACVVTAGTGDSSVMDLTINVYNVTTAAYLLSTSITIESGETDSVEAVTQPVVDAAEEDISEGDLLRVDILGVQATPPQGLILTITAEAEEDVDTVDAAITASTTQSQGQQALTKQLNIVTTVANANDVVTLPAALAGLRCCVANLGANTLQIFPASSDNLGAGVDTSTTLAAGFNVTFKAYDATNWIAVS